MAKRPRIEGRKRGAASRRRGASSSKVAGITTAAVETGLAIATKHGGSAIERGALAYAIEKSGVPIFEGTKPLRAQDIMTLGTIPCVIGTLDTSWKMLNDKQVLGNALETVSLYAAPMEFQFVSQDGISRFCIPYSKAIDSALPDVTDLIESTFQILPAKQQAEAKFEMFTASSKIVTEHLRGESYYVPWGVHDFGVQ